MELSYLHVADAHQRAELGGSEAELAGQGTLAVVFGAEWVQDQRRPPHQRAFGRHRKVLVVLAALLAIAAFTTAMAFRG